MRMLKAALPFVLCATMLAQKPTPIPPGPAHTGIWWNAKSTLYKEAFIGGYKAGAKHVAGHAIEVNQFPGNELIDGLDRFYHDFRNRSILIDEALNFVAEQMRGVPDEKLKIELEHMRAAAAPAASEE